MEHDYLIWSNEHRAWWGPDRHGYTQQLSNAGRYTHAEALEICVRAMPGAVDLIGMLPEMPVRLTDVLAMQAAYHGAYSIPPGAWE